MKRKPTDPLRDKLVNQRLISMAYGQIGFRHFNFKFFTLFFLIFHVNFRKKE